MIRHIIKLIWNRKSSLVWIFVEQALVFGILVACFTNVVNKVSQHLAKGNINVDNVMYIGYTRMDRNEKKNDNGETDDATFSALIERIKDWQSVDVISMNSHGSIPGLNNYSEDSVTFDKGINPIAYGAVVKYCDENYYRMLSLKLSEGEWYRDADASLEIPPALITQKLADKAGITSSAIGKNIYYKGRNYHITGVVEAFKELPNSEQQAVLFMPFSGSATNNKELAVKIKQGMETEFSKAFFEEFYRYFPRDQYLIFAMNLSNFMGMQNFFSLLRVYIFSIPTAFLLIFAFLGTFGVVWMQTKKRLSEMGLRMALGCTPARMMLTVIAENMILTTFAMLPTLIVVANLYAFAPRGVEWTMAVIAAIVLMWLFSTFSAWYPARQASRVQPVEALKSQV